MHLRLRFIICSLVAFISIPALLWTGDASSQSKDSTPKTKAIPCPQSARHIEGDPGDQQIVVCPAHCRGPLIWGTGVYADDSSICVAARHSGAYDGTESQRIVVELLPGQARYEGSEQHGITSHDWGTWPRSFAVYSVEGAANAGARAQPMAAQTQTDQTTIQPRSALSPQPMVQRPSTQADQATTQKPDAQADVFARHAASSTDAPIRRQTVDCSLRGDELLGKPGSKHVVRCPSGCNDESIWGSGPYNDDSSVCASAIHAGAIPPDKGGLVRVTIQGEVHNAKASNAHGMQSQAWSYWPRSFRVEAVQ